MNSKNLWYLRYKQGSQGVQSSLIEASTAQKAEEVGHAFCGQMPNRRFIRIDPAVVADESILVDDPNAAPPESQDVPNNNLNLKALQEDSGGLVGAGTSKSKR